MTKSRDVLQWHAELDTGEVEPHPAFALYPRSTALLVIDLQARPGETMPAELWARTLSRAEILVRAARRLELPILATEQDPERLGPTAPSILEALPDGSRPIGKTTFSCAALPEVRQILKKGRRRQVVVCGQAAHVAVFQSVRRLVERGYFVHVAADACCSADADDLRAGLDLMSGAGATLTTTETVLMDLVQGSTDEAFADVAALLDGSR